MCRFISLLAAVLGNFDVIDDPGLMAFVSLIVGVGVVIMGHLSFLLGGVGGLLTMGFSQCAGVFGAGGGGGGMMGQLVSVATR